MRPTALAALFCLASLAAACAAPAPVAPPPAPEPEPSVPDTFEPSSGVVCSRGREVCEWRGGASVGLTRLFFGDAAGDAVEPEAARRAYRQDPLFTVPGGATCDTLVTTCYEWGVGASEVITGEYFGPDAVERLAARRGEVVRFGNHVTCDQGSQICYDRFGASVGVTHVYLGAEGAETLLPRLRHD